MSVNRSTHPYPLSSSHFTALTLGMLVGPLLGSLTGMQWLQQQAIALGQQSESLFAGRTLPRLPFPKG